MNIPDVGAWHKGIGSETKPQSLKTALKDWFSGQRPLRPLGEYIKEYWPFGAMLVLSGSLGLGLRLEIRRENNQPQDPLWIEQLPASVLSSGVATSTASDDGSDTFSAQTLPEASKPAVTTATRTASRPAQTQTLQKVYVASKTGKKYYLPTCAGAKRIKNENKVWFATKEAAAAAGYQPAAKCKGI